MKIKTKFIALPLTMLIVSVIITGCAKTAAQGAPKVVATANVNGWVDPLAVSNAADKSGLAPDFTGTDVITGKTISLKQFAGKMVLLNFVNYGCSASVNTAVSAQLLDIQTLSKQRSDFVPVSVFCGCCPASALRQFAQTNNLNWPWILDTGNTIVPKYGTYLGQYGYPTLVFIDGNGKITGADGQENSAELGQKLDKMIAAAGIAQ
jgi:peroxiredoxin